ncbi:DNA recombination protein RmuC [Pedobacter puniceum]|uniref:DNA recombination protein RmuC n=1 Tax=Pedobacter puniceum TaxID=2666136 RepID=A0A7K0FNS7_9SPHI|nr:DNA recombination protein RmuC [Pedobacter puniceum]MRX47583.1 DNA recombination protein RmuC [Pedobacter puniceum]
MEYIITAIIILLIAVFLFLKKPSSNTNDAFLNELKAENEQLKINLAVSQQQQKSLIEEKNAVINLLKEEKQDAEFKLLGRINALEDDKKELQDMLNAERKKIATLEESYKAQQQRLEEQKQYMAELQQRFKTEFENVANQILKEKTKEFTDVNKANLDVLLNPLKENIKAFEQKVEQTYKVEANERFTLKGTIDELIKQTKLIQDDASNLTKALKGDNKKQGNWGEMVLDKLLEGSGLIEGINYTKQAGFIAEDGNRYLPDILLNLPENKHIIIDAKVSLVAYEKLVNCDEETEREALTKLHVNSIKSHIQGLSNKNYQDLYQINSPEFVLLFIPIESSFAMAVQYDQELFDFAWNKKVVIVTPSTLLATLKTVASIWKQEQQTKNAIDIATKAGALYDKFVGFVGDIQKIGDSLDKSQKAYQDALGKLSTGNGNLVTRAEQLRKLGAKTSKLLDDKLIEE